MENFIIKKICRIIMEAFSYASFSDEDFNPKNFLHKFQNTDMKMLAIIDKLPKEDYYFLYNGHCLYTSIYDLPLGAWIEIRFRLRGGKGGLSI